MKELETDTHIYFVELSLDEIKEHFPSALHEEWCPWDDDQVDDELLEELLKKADHSLLEKLSLRTIIKPRI